MRKLVPDMIAGGLLGHPFMCPDMIGGGEWTAFLPGAPFDPDLFVRSAQVHALCGMMQFSASPWRVLDEARQQIIRDVVVAPVVKRGAVRRKVVLPPGKWRDADGTVHEGPTTLEVAAPLACLPHFVRE